MIKLKRVIWVAAFPLVPGYGATSAKSCGILRGLGRRVRVQALVNTDNYSEEECLARLRSFWGAQPELELKVISSRRPAWRATAPYQLKFLNEARLDSRRIVGEVNRLRDGENVPVVLDDAILSRMLGILRQPVLHSPHDCLSRLYRVEARYARTLRTKIAFVYRYLVVDRYERTRYHLARSVHLVNADDAKLLQAQNPAISVFLCPIASLLPPAESSGVADRDLDLLVWGNFRSGPVRSGAARIHELIEENPGRWAGKKVLFLGREVGRLQLKSHLGQERTDDLVGLLRRVKVSALPDQDGAGIKNRAMDCLSQGVCLIGIRSQLGGLPTPLDYCVPCESIEDVFTNVESVLTDGSYKRLGLAGLRAFSQYLTPESVSHRFFDHLVDLQHMQPRSTHPRIAGT